MSQKVIFDPHHIAAKEMMARTAVLMFSLLSLLSFAWSFQPSLKLATFGKSPLRTAACRGRGTRGAAGAVAAMEVIEPSYNLALGSFVIGAGLLTEAKLLADRQTFLAAQPEVDSKRIGIAGIAKIGSLIGGVPFALFGLFLAYQTTTLRFTFDDTFFSLVKADLSSTGENVVVGGENKWAYDKFVNYDFFPSEGFPILVYFKETQTAQDQWNVGPGEQANSPEAIAKGAKPGQVHFFPAIANVQQIKAEFVKHNCAKL